MAVEGLSCVRMEGLEPPCLAALDPKSSASTNFATSACCVLVCNSGAKLQAVFLIAIPGVKFSEIFFTLELTLWPAGFAVAAYWLHFIFRYI